MIWGGVPVQTVQSGNSFTLGLTVRSIAQELVPVAGPLAPEQEVLRVRRLSEARLFWAHYEGVHVLAPPPAPSSALRERGWGGATLAHHSRIRYSSASFVSSSTPMGRLASSKSKSGLWCG